MPAPLDRITKAAIKVFRKNGIENTTMEEVAQLARISRPNIYRYVRNRNDLLKLVVLDSAHHILKELKPIKGRWHEVLVNLFVQQVQYAQTDEIFLIIIEQAAPIASQLLVEDTDVRTSLNEIILPVLKQGRSAGELRDDLDDEEILYWLHYQTWCLARDPRIHAQEEIENLARKFIIGGLKKQ